MTEAKKGIHGKKMGLPNGAFVCDMDYFQAMYPERAAHYLSQNKPENVQKGGRDNIVLYAPKEAKIKEFVDIEGVFSDFGAEEPINKIIIYLEEYSYLKIYAIMKKESFKCSIHLEKSSKFDGFFLFSEGKILEQQVNLFLMGSDAQANINGCYFVDDDQTICLKTLQHHKAKNTQSRVTVCGVASGNANCHYEGKVIIDHGCKKVDVLQNNKNLLIGRNAVVHASPIVEARENDVTCTHGCAVGTFDKEKLFYLKSRGLTEEQAQMVLIEGFFDFFIHSLDNQIVKKDLIERMRVKMRHMI